MGSGPPDDLSRVLAGPHWDRAESAPTDDNITPLRLVLTSGNRTIDVRRPNVVVGRHSRADIRLPAPDISRRHCRLLYVDGRWHIVDLGSLNGTYVNGRRVERAVLNHQDVVQIGSLMLVADIPSETLSLGPKGVPKGPGTQLLQSIAEVLAPSHRDLSQGQRRAS
ncbi:MAG: FHA domain-containing protein [Gemmataceae bacterium]|nr:FHA domain-containing protein [Gemmataceae bacterium]MDW8265214.1 FHA domain-containing protein [Gemmataceae bacterium]